jgi:hypothetical protein
MIVTAVLTLTLFFSDPAELVQVFAPTQGLVITAAPRDGCNQVDAWLVQCWASAADGLPLTVSYTCPTRNAVLVVKRDHSTAMYEMKCRWRLAVPWLPVDARQ